MSGMQPMRVRILDPAGEVSEFSDYYAAESGFLSLEIVPAANDLAGRWTIEVEELMSGMRQKALYRLAPVDLRE